jgi:hypothetical protein
MLRALRLRLRPLFARTYFLRRHAVHRIFKRDIRVQPDTNMVD